MTTSSAPSHRREHAPRWTAPLTAFGSLVVLGSTYIYFSLAQVTFLEVPDTENAALARQFDLAAQRASGAADALLLVAAGVVLLAGLLGAIRPVRRAGTLIAVFTALALVAIWVTTRADIALLSTHH